MELCSDCLTMFCEGIFPHLRWSQFLVFCGSEIFWKSRLDSVWVFCAVVMFSFILLCVSLFVCSPSSAYLPPICISACRYLLPLSRYLMLVCCCASFLCNSQCKQKNVHTNCLLFVNCHHFSISMCFLLEAVSNDGIT